MATVSKYLMVIGSAMLTYISCCSQPVSSKPNSLSVGLTAGHYHYDPGIGIEITTPGLFIRQLRIRLKANETWFDHYKSVNDRWVTYSTYWLGLVYYVPALERGRGFFEAGSYNIVPNKVFSSTTYGSGYYASAGLELLVLPYKDNVTYFFSGGYASVPAHADKMPGSPRLGTGITFATGFRVYF